MEKIYVSIGADCGSAGMLREAGKKTFSFPFDWLVCFHSVHTAFENDFKGFLEDRVINPYVAGVNEFNYNYNIRFFHRDLIKDYDRTIQRRVDRLLELLKSSDKEVIFLRRSHGVLHHDEMRYCGIRAPQEIDDVKDMELLVEVLKRKYPQLKFKINLFLMCPHCNKGRQNSDSEHLNIRVSTQMHILRQNEEPYAREFANWVKTL